MTNGYLVHRPEEHALLKRYQQRAGAGDEGVIKRATLILMNMPRRRSREHRQAGIANNVPFLCPPPDMGGVQVMRAEAVATMPADG